MTAVLAESLSGFDIVGVRYVRGWRSVFIDQVLDALANLDEDFSAIEGERRKLARARRRQNMAYNFGTGRAVHLANSHRQYRRDMERLRSEYDAFKRRWTELVPGRRCMGMDHFRRFFRHQFRELGDVCVSRVAQGTA